MMKYDAVMMQYAKDDVIMFQTQNSVTEDRVYELTRSVPTNWGHPTFFCFMGCVQIQLSSGQKWHFVSFY